MENLYETLNSKVKANVNEVNKLKEEKRKKLINSQYCEAKSENKYNVNTTKAYYYYRFFITKILPMLIKEHIETNNALNLVKAIQKAFDYELQVSNYSNGIIHFEKTRNMLTVSFNDYEIYKEFINYLDAFFSRCGVDTSNEYLSGKKYYFDNLTISDILNAYYGELQRFQYSDELIDSIQEEENTNINGEELTKNIMKR